MKSVVCSNPGCKDRRIHWSKPDSFPATGRKLLVSDAATGKHYCSIECSIYDESESSESTKE